MLRENIIEKTLIILLIGLLLFPGVIDRGEIRSVNLSDTHEIYQPDSTRSVKPTNVTVSYNQSHIFFYVDVVGDTTIWEDNTDSLSIFIDGDGDGAIKEYSAPRGSVRDFGMIAFSGWDFGVYEFDRFGYLVKDSGTEDRDQDARLGNLMIDTIANNGTYNLTFRAGKRSGHRIYEVEINASHFGITLDPTTVFNMYLRVTRDDETGNVYTTGSLNGSSSFPDDLDWYEVDFSNPGNQELTVTDVTGQEPNIDGRKRPGEWPATPMNITRYDALPRRSDNRIFYPDDAIGVMPDGFSEVKIVFEVRDYDDVFGVTSVMANFTDLGIPMPTEMKDDGTGGDEVANDRNFTYVFTALETMVPGGYYVSAHIFDLYANHLTSMMVEFYISIVELNTPPGINVSAPRWITLTEDNPPIYFYMENIFNDSQEDPMDFRVADQNGTWGLKYQSKNLTGEFIANGSFRVKVKSDVHFPNNHWEAMVFKAADRMGFATFGMNFTIESVNDDPEMVFFRSQVTAKEDMDTKITIKAKDSRDMTDTLTLTTNFSTAIPNLNVGLSSTKDDSDNTYTFILNFTPTNGMIGEYPINITLSDNDFSSSPSLPTTLYKDFTLTIINTNDAPYFTSFKMEGGKNISGDAGEVKFNIDEDESVAMIISGNDPDFIHGDEVLDFSLADHYPDRTAIEKISDSKSRLTYIPRPDFNGDEVITVKLTDGEVTLSKTIRFRIEPVNDPPVTKHWEIWTATGDNDSTTPEIENLSYRFHVRDKARKEILTNETIMDVDGDLVEFAWFYYKDGEAVNLLWDQANEKGTSLVKNFKESEQGEWIIVLMCNDNNGSFQIIEENNITVKKYIEIEENGGNGIVKHDRTEVPFLIIILCAVFLIVIIVGFVFFTSRTKFNMLEKAAKEREEAERVRIIEAVESSYQAQSAWAEQETEVYQGDFEESFFGVGPTSDAEEETFDLDLELPESGPALPIESPMMADATPAQQLPPSPPPTAPLPGTAPLGGPQTLPPSPSAAVPAGQQPGVPTTGVPQPAAQLQGVPTTGMITQPQEIESPPPISPPQTAPPPSGGAPGSPPVQPPVPPSPPPTA